MFLLATPFTAVFQLFFLAALYGLMIRLAQPDKADFSVVVRVIAYSAAPCVFSIVPFVGSAVASVWCVAVSFAGCKYALGLSWGKTALALAPLFILGVAVLVQMSLLMRSMLCRRRGLCPPPPPFLSGKSTLCGLRPFFCICVSDPGSLPSFPRGPSSEDFQGVQS